MDLPKNFADTHYHIPKLLLTEIFPLTPYLMDYDHLTVVDVGANQGLWLEAFFRAFGPSINRYFAIEPMAANLSCLTSKRGVSNLITFNGCAGAFDGQVALHFDKEITTLASVCNDQSNLGSGVVALGNTRTVKQVKLDTLLAEHGAETVHLLKIDVEGYEVEVIQGIAEKLQQKQVLNIFFEFGTHNLARGHTFGMLFEMLSKYGFSIYKSVRGHNYFGLNAVQRYNSSLEPSASSVDMYLATLVEPSPSYRGPRITGRLS
jgi:FkbM family methyltransferase